MAYNNIRSSSAFEQGPQQKSDEKRLDFAIPTDCIIVSHICGSGLIILPPVSLPTNLSSSLEGSAATTPTQPTRSHQRYLLSGPFEGCGSAIQGSTREIQALIGYLPITHACCCCCCSSFAILGYFTQHVYLGGLS